MNATIRASRSMRLWTICRQHYTFAANGKPMSTTSLPPRSTKRLDAPPKWQPLPTNVPIRVAWTRKAPITPVAVKALSPYRLRWCLLHRCFRCEEAEIKTTSFASSKQCFRIAMRPSSKLCDEGEDRELCFSSHHKLSENRLRLVPPPPPPPSLSNPYADLRCTRSVHGWHAKRFKHDLGHSLAIRFLTKGLRCNVST